MANILFLAHRIPYPPNKGDKIRSWNIFRHLTKSHRMYLGCFIDDPEDFAHQGFLSDQCAEAFFVPINRRLASLKSLTALFRGGSLSLRFYECKAMTQWVEALLEREQIDAIYVFSSTMAQFAFVDNRDATPVIMDFVDVDSQKWAQYAHSKPWPLSWLYAHEARMLLEAERQIAERSDENLFVSKEEASLFKSLLPKARHVEAMPNGVDLEAFDREAHEAADLGPGHHLIFTGAMDYWANVDAIRWFVEKCWQELKRRWPDLTFHIVGSNPSAAVRALAKNKDIFVTGRVDKVQPYLKAADVVIAPLQIARGIQNKVLEALAMSCPVVATEEAAEGLGLETGEYLLITDSETAFVEAVHHLLSEPGEAENMAARAAEKVRAEFGWDGRLALLDELLATEKANYDKVATAIE